MDVTSLTKPTESTSVVSPTMKPELNPTNNNTYSQELTIDENASPLQTGPANQKQEPLISAMEPLDSSHAEQSAPRDEAMIASAGGVLSNKSNLVPNKDKPVTASTSVAVDSMGSVQTTRSVAVMIESIDEEEISRISRATLDALIHVPQLVKDLQEFAEAAKEERKNRASLPTKEDFNLLTEKLEATNAASLQSLTALITAASDPSNNPAIKELLELARDTKKGLSAMEAKYDQKFNTIEKQLNDVHNLCRNFFQKIIERDSEFFKQLSEQLKKVEDAGSEHGEIRGLMESVRLFLAKRESAYLLSMTTPGASMNGLSQDANLASVAPPMIAHMPLAQANLLPATVTNLAEMEATARAYHVRQEVRAKTKKLASAAKAHKKTSACLVCHDVNHATEDCVLFPSPEERVAAIQKENRCLICLRAGCDGGKACTRDRNRHCERCSHLTKPERLHHPQLCTFSGRKASSVAEQADTSGNALIASQKAKKNKNKKRKHESSQTGNDGAQAPIKPKKPRHENNKFQKKAAATNSNAEPIGPRVLVQVEDASAPVPVAVSEVSASEQQPQEPASSSDNASLH